MGSLRTFKSQQVILDTPSIITIAEPLKPQPVRVMTFKDRLQDVKKQVQFIFSGGYLYWFGFIFAFGFGFGLEETHFYQRVLMAIICGLLYAHCSIFVKVLTYKK